MSFLILTKPSCARNALRLTRTVCVTFGLTVGACGSGQSIGVQDTPVEQGKIVSLKEALKLAQAYSPQFQAAHASLASARENRLQAREARLPTLDALNQVLYTEGNGTPSGVFTANDGVHVYNEQAVVRQNLLGLLRNGRSREAGAAEAVARAQLEIARRGLVMTVVQSYYDLVAAKETRVNAEDSLREAENFGGVTRKQELVGEVSHVDVVKAELQVEQRSRDVEDSELAAAQAHVALAVLLSPHFDDTFTVEDWNTASGAPPSLELTKTGPPENSPEIQNARAALKEAQAATTVARYAYLPALTFNFYYGIDANQLQATSNNVYGATKSTQQNTIIPNRQNLGYAADLTLDLPLWNWGATRSKVRQAESNVHLAEVKEGFAERQLQADVRSISGLVEVAQRQVASLLRSRDLAIENLHLTMLRYQAGEATALEAVAAQDSATLSRNAYNNGLKRYYTALARLQTLTGVL